MSLRTRVQVPVIDDQSPFVGSWIWNQEASCDPGTVGSDYPSFINESFDFFVHLLFLDSPSPYAVAGPGLRARLQLQFAEPHLLWTSRQGIGLDFCVFLPGRIEYRICEVLIDAVAKLGGQLTKKLTVSFDHYPNTTHSVLKQSSRGSQVESHERYGLCAYGSHLGAPLRNLFA